MLNDTDTPTTVWASAQDLALQVLQAIDIRLALLLGLAAFLIAVSFDSSGNPAEAADLAMHGAPVPVVITAAPQPVAERFASDAAAQLATARRLHHGGLTSAIITNNRLTDAHFFTDLPLQP